MYRDVNVISFYVIIYLLKNTALLCIIDLLKKKVII